PVAVADSFATDEDHPVTITAPGALTNDTDPDGDTLTAGALDTTGTKGAVALNPDGSFTYNPNGQFEALDTGETATDSFTYKAYDGTAKSAVATVTITINGVNDAPVAVNDSGATFTTDENSPVTVAAPGVLANDTDPDGDTLNA